MEASSQSLVDTYYTIAPERFHFLKFIIEGYDNLAVVSSVPNRREIVRLKCSPESLPELLMLMATIAGSIKRPCL